MRGTKLEFVVGLMLFVSSLFAYDFSKNWIPAQKNVKKDFPNSIVFTPHGITLNGIKSIDPWIFFMQKEIPVTAEKQLKITLSAAGKGTFQVGYFGSRNKNFAGAKANAIPIILTSKAKEYKISLPVRNSEVKFVRPLISVPANGEIKITAFSIEIADDVPEYACSGNFDRTDAVYKIGEKAKLTLKFEKNGTLMSEGTAHIRLDRNGHFNRSKFFTFDIAEGNPVTLDVAMDEPGFAVAVLDKLQTKDKKVLFRQKQLAGVAFSPEQIKSGAPVPPDLLDYWKGEYAKLNKEVPANFKLVKQDERGNMIRYRLSCDNFGGTQSYGSIVMPKGKGPFPMILTVPPAGNYGFGFFRTPGAIHVTISVFDRLFPTSQDYANFAKPEWYFFKGAQQRNTYYYYKTLLGVMRMMDYAMTQIKEWDGKHLIAIGRSQGGGFAMIMTALNPKIQALVADVPALCDHNGRFANRRPGWPQLLDFKNTAKSFSEGAKYFDAANFAAFIDKPALLSVGFLDTMCEPSSVYVAFNNLKGPKKIFHCTQYGHGWGIRGNEFNDAKNAVIRKYLELK